jgi:hypothetical protein
MEEITGVIVVPVGIGMAGFLMWLQYRDSETNHRNGDGMTSERELKL